MGGEVINHVIYIIFLFIILYFNIINFYYIFLFSNIII